MGKRLQQQGRRRTGRAAENLAVRFLKQRGHQVLDRNVRVAGGEIDILAMVDGQRTVVEVRSRWNVGRDGSLDPLHAFDKEKAAQVRRLAATPQLRAARVDLIAVGFHNRGVEILWLPRVA